MGVEMMKRMHTWCDLARTGALAVQIALALQELDYGVVGHVNRTVRQGFNHELLVPGKLRAQTKLSRAGPLVQPLQSFLELLQGGGVVSLEGAIQMLVDKCLPLRLTVIQKPIEQRTEILSKGRKK